MSSDHPIEISVTEHYISESQREGRESTTRDSYMEATVAPNSPFTENPSGVGGVTHDVDTSDRATNREPSSAPTSPALDSPIGPGGFAYQGKSTSLLGAIRTTATSRQKALRKALDLRRSRFAEWTREELLQLLIVENEYEIRDEFNVETLSLRDLCDELYHEQPMPDKVEKKSLREMRKVEAGVQKFQNLWIDRRFRKRAQEGHHAAQYDSEYGAMLLNEDDFDYTAETLEIDEVHRLLQENPDMVDADIHDVHIDLGDPEDPLAVGGGSPQRTPRQASQDSGDHELGQALRKKPSLMMARQTQNLLDTPWKAPDHEKAEASKAFTHPRKGGKGGDKFSFKKTTTGRHCTLGGFGEQCDLWEEGFVSEFSIYGPGITNYFKFQKWLFWVVFVWAIITTPLLVTNIAAHTAEESQGFTDLAQTTVGNLAPVDVNQTINVRLPGCDSDVYGYENCNLDRDTLGTFYVSIDVAGTVFVFIAFLWLSYYERKEETILDKNTVYASMFTIAVKDLPRDTDEIELMMHFERLLQNSFQIVDIEMATECEEEVEQCKRRGDLIRKKIRLIHEHRFDCTQVRANEPNYEKADVAVQKLRKRFFEKVKRIDKGIKNFDQTLLKLSQVPEKPLTAYITFDQSVASLIIADLYRSSLYNTCCFNPTLLFKQRKLRVKKAPEPSTIIWENLQYGFWKRKCRNLVTTVLALFLVLTTVFMASSSTTLQTKALNEAGYELCPDDFDDLTKAEQQAAVEADPEILHCYCDGLSHFDQANDDTCKTYFEDYVQAEVITYFATFVVLCVNSLVEYAITAFAEFEKHHSEDTKERSIFTRLFLLKYLNTSVVFLIASNAYVLDKVYGVDADHSTEFTSIWFESVGVTIMLVQFGDIAFAQGRSFKHWFFHRYNIRRARENPKAALTQADLNLLYVGPDFKISYRYAQLMATFFVCMTFNPGMPLLNWIAATNFLVYYFVDKYLFINLYQIPHRFTTKIGREATKLIPLGLAVHCAMGVWVYSNQEIFSDERTENSVFQEGSSYLGPEITEKLQYKQVLPLLVLFLVIAAYFILNMGSKYLRRSLRQVKTYLAGDKKGRMEIQEKLRQARSYGAQVLFKKAVKRNIIKGLASYNILQNPVYKEKFSISWSFAMTHNKVRSVRLTTAQAENSSFYEGAEDASRVERMRRQVFSGAFSESPGGGGTGGAGGGRSDQDTDSRMRQIAQDALERASPKPSPRPTSQKSPGSGPQKLGAAVSKKKSPNSTQSQKPRQFNDPRYMPRDRQEKENLQREQLLAREIALLDRVGTMDPGVVPGALESRDAGDDV